MSAYLFPRTEDKFIGRSAHPITRYMSWVQNDVNQFGLYLEQHYLDRSLEYIDPIMRNKNHLYQYARTAKILYEPIIYDISESLF